MVASGRSGDRMQPESISRLARRALDRGGLAGVQLMDLRHDWILRCLKEQDWPTVARISGVAVRSCASIPGSPPSPTTRSDS